MREIAMINPFLIFSKSKKNGYNPIPAQNISNKENLPSKTVTVPQDAKALYALGWRYENGHGVEKNDTLAMKYYKQSADLGYAKGQYAAGLYYYKKYRILSKNLHLHYLLNA